MKNENTPSANIDPAEILPGKLYLGSKLSAANLDALQSIGITHIVNAADELPNYHEEKFEYLHLSLKDDVSDDLVGQFPTTNAFIADGDKVFVHCQAGISRSAALVMAYLMSHLDWTLKNAFLRIKARRPNAGPNKYFMQALTRYEDSLRPDSQKGQPPSFSMEEYCVSTLADMGFEERIAEIAVKSAAGNFELALSLCLMKS